MRTMALLLAAFGTWKIDVTRSTFAGDTQPKSLTVLIEPHANGEVFTVDRVEADGHAISSSSILYLDGAVEILRMRSSGAWTRYVRRLSVPPKEMFLEITDQHPDGRRFERRMVLEKR